MKILDLKCQFEFEFLRRQFERSCLCVCVCVCLRERRESEDIIEGGMSTAAVYGGVKSWSRKIEDSFTR